MGMFARVKRKGEDGKEVGESVGVGEGESKRQSWG